MVRGLLSTHVLVGRLQGLIGARIMILRIGALLRIVVLVQILRRIGVLSRRSNKGLVDVLGGIQMTSRATNLSDVFRATRSRILELQPRSSNLGLKKKDLAISQ